jgi:argininosuccinate lyase
MNQHADVSIRERVKLPPSATMVESYYKPKLATAIRTGFETEIWIHIAHASMLERQKIIDRNDLRTILDALLSLHGQGPDALAIDYSIEDMYSYTERFINKVAGPDVGGRMHTGRSRNDLNVTTSRMVLRAFMIDLLQDLSDLRQATLKLADTHAETVMPGYTHWQHAQPITFGYYLLAFADQLERDATRCLAALRNTNNSPLGAGALSGTGFPLDRQFTAKALGSQGLVEVAYDAVSSRDDGHETAAALAILMTNLSRLSVDLQAWSTMEYRFIELGDQHSSVSSIMPQKKNPSCLEHIKAQAGRVTGALVATLSSTKNTAFADVSDGVTGVDIPVIEAATITRNVVRLTTDVLQTLSIFPERMAHFAAIGYGTATELADVIVREKGLSFRKAHNIVATVVTEAIEQGRNADEITSADLDAASVALFGSKIELSDAAVREALEPMENVMRRTIIGGPAPTNVRAMVRSRLEKVDEDRRSVTAIGRLAEEEKTKCFGEARSILKEVNATSAA